MSLPSFQSFVSANSRGTLHTDVKLRIPISVASFFLAAIIAGYCLHNLRTTFGRTDISPSNIATEEEVNTTVAKIAHSNEFGLSGRKTSLFGYVIEGEIDRYTTTEYPGIPGGRWTLVVGILLIGLLLPILVQSLIRSCRMLVRYPRSSTLQ
jgi:hypothetical protein